MSKTTDSIVLFKQCHPKRTILSALALFLILSSLTIIIALDSLAIAAIYFAITLFLVCIFLWAGFGRIVIDSNGVSEYVWRFQVANISKENIRSVVHRSHPGYRGDWVQQLVITSDTVEEMIASGEQQAQKRLFVKHELPFLKRRADYAELMIGYWRPKCKCIIIEFSVERQQILQDAFPSVEFQNGKHYANIYNTKK